MSGEKNQYGRRVWDVEEYAERAKHRRHDHKERKVQSNATILAQTDVQYQKLVKDDWFRCELCDRRFKDSSKLADHLSGPQHLSNLRKYEENNPKEEVTLNMVKNHLRKLQIKLNKQGWLEGVGLGGSTEERLLRQQQILEYERSKKQKL